MSNLKRFFTYADQHKLKILVTREIDGKWMAFIPDDYRPHGNGSSPDEALEGLAKAVAAAGIERPVPIPTPIPTPKPAREKLPPFVLAEVAADA